MTVTLVLRGRGGTGLTGYTDAHVAYSTMPSQEGRIGAVVEPRGQAIRRVRQTTEIALTAQLEGFPDNSRAVVLDHKDAAQAIVEYARDVGAGLIAMATHSRRPIAELFTGSITEAVVRSGVAPVVVEHPAG